MSPMPAQFDMIPVVKRPSVGARNPETTSCPSPLAKPKPLWSRRLLPDPPKTPALV
jgi:hypothetical protein